MWSTMATEAPPFQMNLTNTHWIYPHSQDRVVKRLEALYPVRHFAVCQVQGYERLKLRNEANTSLYNKMHGLDIFLVSMVTGKTLCRMTCLPLKSCGSHL